MGRLLQLDDATQQTAKLQERLRELPELQAPPPPPPPPLHTHAHTHTRPLAPPGSAWELRHLLLQAKVAELQRLLDEANFANERQRRSQSDALAADERARRLEQELFDAQRHIAQLQVGARGARSHAHNEVHQSACGVHVCWRARNSGVCDVWA